MARNTYEGSRVAEAQAEPVETANPGHQQRLTIDTLKTEIDNTRPALPLTV